MKKKIVVYTAGFKKAFVVEGVSGVTGKNNLRVESLLNSEKGDRITLENACCYVLGGGVYKPADHFEGSPTLNTDLISFIYGASNLVYSKTSSLEVANRVSLLWDFNHPAGSLFSHRIIGDVDVRGSGVPRIKRGADKAETYRFRSKLSSFVENRTSRNFITLHNIRADSEGAQEELELLFGWLKIAPDEIERVLINNRKHSDTCLGYDIYLGPSSVNFDNAQ